MERTDSVDIDYHHEDVGTVDYAGSHEDDEGNSLQCTNKLYINCCSILKFDSATYSYLDTVVAPMVQGHCLATSTVSYNWVVDCPG